MVINITDVKNGDFDAVKREICTLKEIAGDKILKVIIETCYLTKEEKTAMCHAVTEAGADYIKTSTGFGTGGAGSGGYPALQRAHWQKCKNKSSRWCEKCGGHGGIFGSGM